MDSQIQRQRRFTVDIPVTVTTVLDSVDAAVVDLTEHGTQIIGCSLAVGTRFQIEYMGQTVFAQCRWSEVDRMGVKFSFPLTDGPLFERLMLARAMQMPGEVASQMAYPSMGNRATAPGVRAFGRAAVGGFGRRGG
ncbi:PilZ domain-containing protein [Sphingobium nicotianae]|uniref:PilZ domain-containing protein n=1 Tax=Sphingobium nicotianae TaxID=2782607 RepID=A0A9X1IPM2_9SPHN|nr:PilZ domain-containing protein [Sphingobium nicotianae]MBT2186192.1 PilZ domain-containing protein [Sphingobium nicotianae]